MTHDSPRVRIVPAMVHGRHLVRVTTQGPPRGWLLGFHGYAHNAEIFLELLERIPAAREWLVASIQALHPFYARGDVVVANWMTRQDRELAITDNVAYVDAVVADLEREYGAPPALVYAGVSQGVAMAYRAAIVGAHAARALIVAGGDLPPELRSLEGRRWPPVLACTGRGDDFYTPRRLEEEVEFMRSRGADVRPLVFEGGHEWSDEVVAAADALLREVAWVSG